MKPRHPAWLEDYTPDIDEIRVCKRTARINLTPDPQAIMPERRLVAHIVGTAIRDRDFRWFQDDSNQPGSFLWCADILDLDVSRIRDWIREMTAWR